MDCPHAQVLQVNLSESDHVTFEDAGGGDDVILANRSILTKGLVVRSRSNQFTIHLSSQRPWAGSLRLHYQGMTLTVSMLMLHASRPALSNLSELNT